MFIVTEYAALKNEWDNNILFICQGKRSFIST